MITEIGTLVGKHDSAVSIANAIAADFRDLLASKAQVRKVAYGIWRDPWMWAGSWTFIHDMLERAGLENVIEETRYPSLSLERIRDLLPEIILLSSEPYPFKEKHIAEVKEVLPDVEVLLVDGEMFSWYGSRLIHAPAYFAQLLDGLKTW